MPGIEPTWENSCKVVFRNNVGHLIVVVPAKLTTSSDKGRSKESNPWEPAISDFKNVIDLI